MDAAIKKTFSTVGGTESLVGAVVLAALAYLLQVFLLRGHDLSHIPLAGEALGSRKKRLAEYSSRTGKAKAMFRDAYQKVDISTRLFFFPKSQSNMHCRINRSGE